MQSITAYSSAILIGGAVDETVAPSWTSATSSMPASFVIFASVAPNRFGLHMNP